LSAIFPTATNFPWFPSGSSRPCSEYDWPGNIRELQNSVHRYITLGEIDFLDLPQPAENGPATPLSGPTIQPDRFDQPLNQAVSAFEKRYIEQLLKENQWHRSRVAELLGIDRRTLFRKMKAYGL
jgi:DNA-binding NtrC family response regulator